MGCAYDKEEVTSEEERIIMRCESSLRFEDHMASDIDVIFKKYAHSKSMKKT
jgi:hypothetical protein